MCPPSWEGETPGERKVNVFIAAVAVVIAVIMLGYFAVTYYEGAQNILGLR